MKQPRDLRQVLAQIPLFAGVPPDALSELAKASRLRRYPKGQVLCSEGDPGDSLIVLEAGQVRVSRFTPEGQEIVLSVVDAPAEFGELALIDGAPRSATITTTGAVAVLLIEQAAFLAVVEREPAAAVALLRNLAGMVRTTNERLTDLLALDVPGRLAKWLLVRSAMQPPTPGATVSFQMSQSDLAAELGATRVSVNRSLKRFERLGTIVVERDRIVIVRPDLLAEQAR